MFEYPFSFEGRIRRTEYGLSIIFFAISVAIINAIVGSSDGGAVILLFAYIPILWFTWAQGAKRCHDIGNSGWWQLIPFYGLWLLFQDGQPGKNQYGENPKGISNSQPYYTPTLNPNNEGSPQDYQGGYNGGHNSSNGSYRINDAQFTQSTEYKEGDLYK